MQNKTLSKNRQAFYLQLESIFAGRELENFKGKSGFANLLLIKLEGLLKKVISNSSNKNSFAMDFFSRSGTTISTVYKLGCKWVGVKSVNIIRIKKTLSALMTGISKELEKEYNLKIDRVVKYYKFEIYEDVLSKTQYLLNKDSSINLYQSEKLATDKVVNIDKEKDRCIFLDEDTKVKIKKNKLNFSEYPFLGKLVWWK